MIFPHEIVSEVVLLVAASLWSETKYATPLTTASAMTHPARKIGPFTLARRVEQHQDHGDDRDRADRDANRVG